MTKHLLALYSFLIISCSSHEHESDCLQKIYFKQNWAHDGILFLSESANVAPISDDSLRFYLTSDEIQLALDSIANPVDKVGSENGPFYDTLFVPSDTNYYRKVIFKNYGKVIENERFSLFNIYKSKTETRGRDHRFQLRTYDPNHKLIATLLFAVWDDDNELYYSGELTSDLKIKRFSGDEGEVECFKID